MTRTNFLGCSLVLVIILLGSCIQSDTSIRVGDYILRGDITIKLNDTLYEGLIQYYDTLGNLTSSFNFKNNKKDGPYYTYYSNEKIESEGNYSCDLENGQSKVYDSTGKIVFSNQDQGSVYR